MTKRTSKQPATPESEDETTSAMVMNMLGAGLERLDTHITGKGSDKTGKPIALDDESAAALAHLLTKIAMVAGELRKAEKAARDADGEITSAQMLDRIRRMSTTERAQFTRSVQSLNADAGRSGLA